MNFFNLSKEIKIRLYHVCLSAVVTFRCSYILTEQSISTSAAPSGNATRNGSSFHLIFTESTEASLAATQPSLAMTTYTLFPVAFYQSRLLIKAGLWAYEKTLITFRFYLPRSPALLCLCTTYLSVPPTARKFSLNLEMASGSILQIHPEAKISAYIPLTIRLIFRCHSSLQALIVVSISIQLGAVDGPILIEKRKIFHFTSVLSSSPIRPPDPLVPFLVLSPIFPFHEFPTSVAPSPGQRSWPLIQ